MINFDKMRPVIYIMLVFSFCLFSAARCKKPHNSVTGGGKGGNGTIIARAEHYGSLLDTAVVYIKYNTLDAPANGVYDDSLIVSTNYQAVFSSLTPGNYYLFTEAIHDPFNPATVEGGKPWTIAGSNDVDTVNIASYQYNFTFPTWWHVL